MTTTMFGAAGLATEDMSMAERLAVLPTPERNRLLDSMAEDVIAALEWDWQFWGRPDQLLPTDPDWLVLALLGGRGSGKTRSGAEAVRDLARTMPGSWGAFVAPTPKDARDLMIEGPSGIIAVSPPDERPRWFPSLNRLEWPNGAYATVYSAAEPEAIRGPNFGWAWCDEVGKWRFMQRAWDNLRFSLRAGERPRTIVTTTPVGHPLIRRILAGEWEGTHVRRVSTYRNAANLAPTFLAELLRQYEGTRLGMQELHGMVLDEIEGALWTMAMIELDRWLPTEAEPEFAVPMRRIVVGVDPSGSKKGAEAGIVVAGVDMAGRGYVLEDVSLKGTPSEWGLAAVAAYHRWQADKIVGERNYGGDMVRTVIEGIDPNVAYDDVSASRGKQLRAEPVVSLYEQHRVKHVGTLGLLETELTQWVPPGTVNAAGEDAGSNWSPGRLDALVWALTELMLHDPPSAATMSTPTAARVPTGVGVAARRQPGLSVLGRPRALWTPYGDVEVPLAA